MLLLTPSDAFVMTARRQLHCALKARFNLRLELWRAHRTFHIETQASDFVPKPLLLGKDVVEESESSLLVVVLDRIVVSVVCALTRGAKEVGGSIDD